MLSGLSHDSNSFSLPGTEYILQTFSRQSRTKKQKKHTTSIHCTGLLSLDKMGNVWPPLKQDQTLFGDQTFFCLDTHLYT